MRTWCGQRLSPQGSKRDFGSEVALGRCAVLGLIALGFSILPIESGSACSWKGGEPSLRGQLQSAESVFIARVISTREVPPGEHLSRESLAELTQEEQTDRLIEAKYRLVERLKGEPPEIPHVYDLPLAHGNCSLGLFAGWDYLFVLQPADPANSLRFVGFSSGSFGLGAYRNADDPDTSELEEVRALLRSLSTEQKTP
jgi:hypothetical protein